jgi:CubicO group peptidase (beta-lactamase class C family)
MNAPRLFRLPCLLAAFLLPAALASAQDAGKLAAITPQMQAFVDQGEISGIVTLVATKDRVLHLSAVGNSDVAQGRKLQTNDLFWIASMTKPITGLAVAMLVDDGKLRFDDPVSKYIPEFAHVTVVENAGRGRANGNAQPAASATPQPVSRPITLRDLLTHTSGMGEYSDREPHLTLAETAARAAQVPLRSQPGTRWAYSTTGIDMLGRVVEVASGMPFDAFLQQRLFTPLGMKDTTFWPTPEQEKRLAKSYIRNTQTGKLEETPINYMYKTAVTDRGRPPLGGAGLFSTAEDIVKVYQMLLHTKETSVKLAQNPGMTLNPFEVGEFNGKRIVRPETIAEMTRKQTGDLKARAGMPWGLAFCVIEDPKAMEANAMLSPGSFGHGGAFGTNSWADPTTGTIYILMLQRDKMGNPDNSPMHRVFQETAAAALRH